MFVHLIIMVVRGGNSMLDKLKILENIKILAKLRKIALNDIEKKSGVSVGYYARLIADIKVAREDGNEEKPLKERPLPSTDVIAKTAEMLGVSVDSLLNYDFENITDPESMLIIFIDNLTKATESNKIHWKKDNESMIYGDISIDGFDHYPLTQIVAERYPDAYEFEARKVFYSPFKDRSTDLCGGGVYRLSFNGQVFLLCETVDENEKYGPDYAYELYNVGGGKITKVAFAECNVEDDNPKPIYTALTGLYKAVDKATKIDPDGKDLIKLINGYMDHFGFKGGED